MTSDTLAVIEQDELRQQIDESRSALVEKLELLEVKVAETVQNATSSVAEATASVIDTVNQATASVSETVETVNTAVQGTVENVQTAVSDTMTSVRDTFDLHEQVRRHPWEMIAGAVLAGYAGGYYLNLAPMTPRRRSVREWDRPYRFQPENERRVATSTLTSSNPVEEQPEVTRAVASPPAQTHYLRDVFGSELKKLQGLAIGVSLGLVRDMLAESAPTSFRPQIEEVIDELTAKLGGERIAGPILPANPSSAAT